MAAAQYSGSLPPAFTAAECTAGTLITGTDRVMVPLVTQPQKDQRRATEWAQRLAQGRSSTASVGRPKQARERPFQEFKLVAFYDPDKAHCQVVGTAGDHTVAGRLMRREARRLALGPSDSQVCRLGRGGVDRPPVSTAITDAGRTHPGLLPPAGTRGPGQLRAVWGGHEEGGAMAGRDDGLGVGAGLPGAAGSSGGVSATSSDRPKHEALESLRDYLRKRVAMTDYPTFASWAMIAVPAPPNRCVAG